jgi:ABC-type branched-subunit amino acid transport system substrate-binding protein/predicted negative regulator of RcsB-dependent stress response
MTHRTFTNSTAPESSINMTRVLALTVSLALTVQLACATTGSRPQTSDRLVEVDGKQVPVEALAKERYDAAVQLRAGGDGPGARRLLEEVVRDFGDASWADHATVALAQIHLDEDRPEQAQSMLETMLLEDPTSPAADQARYLLALAQLAQGDTQSAAPTLKNLVEKMPNEREKKAAALKLADQLYKQRQPAEAARYLSRALELSDDPAEQQEISERLFAVIDTEVGFRDARRLKELEAKPGTLLDELLTYKLARVHLHLRDYISASEAAQDYLGRYGSGRFAKDAQSLQASLRARVKVEPRTVGVILPLTGPYRMHGQRALTAIKLGLGLPVSRDDYYKKVEAEEAPVEEAPAEADPMAGVDMAPPKLETAAGGDLSVTAKPKDSKVGPIRLVVRDSRGDPTRATDLVRHLVEEENAIAIIGDILLDTSLPVALKAEEYGIPAISLSRRDGLPELGPYVFRMSFTAKKQARALADLAMDTMGHKRFAILYPRHSYGLELMNAFWDEIEKRKGEVTAIENYGHDQTTFTREAKSLVGRLHLAARYEYAKCNQEARAIEDPYRRKKAGERCKDAVTPLIDFDALLIPDDYRTVSYIVPALAAEDMLVTTDKYAVAAYKKTTEVKRARPIQLLGGSMWNSAELAKRLPRQIDGAVAVDGFDVHDQTKQVQTFVKSFAEVHRSRPGMMEAQSHDAGALVAAILEGSGKPAPKNRREMRATLAGAKDFPGVTGLVVFDEAGDSATPPLLFTFDRDRIERAKAEDFAAEGDG